LIERSHTTVIRPGRREHSRKPEEFYALVKITCPGSEVEIFSRQERAGWQALGHEPDLFSK
jgi:N6-adenosine-specific RNA methylase IME4